MRIVVGMSGGVDSSAAAAILAGEGHEVVGMTLRLLDASEPGRGRSCCTPDDVQDARAAARKLGIPHYVADAEERFSRAVVDGFVEDYLAGLTPNPCVACNEEVKFGWLLARARALGAKLATGHYARAERAGGRWVLRAARHPAKDQSYFLHRLGQEELADLLFPLGDLEKPDVRRIAAHHGLPAADKVESQEACFVGRGTAAEFVELRAPERLSPGEVIDTSGEVLGRHPGVHHFTVGQRRGLGIGGGAARYVVELDPGLSRVVVGTAAEASRDRFHVGGVRWVAGRPPPGPVELLVKVRHRHQGELGAVTPVDGGAVVCLAAAVRGVAPGQSAVFYAGDEVVGGGRILRG